jgi:hypothetical protein
MFFSFILLITKFLFYVIWLVHLFYWVINYDLRCCFSNVLNNLKDIQTHDHQSINQSINHGVNEQTLKVSCNFNQKRRETQLRYSSSSSSSSSSLSLSETLCGCCLCCIRCLFVDWVVVVTWFSGYNTFCTSSY